MTIPIARVVGTRYTAAEPPLRFCYVAAAYRSVRPQRGQAREMLQAGIELVGAPGPDGTAEAIGVLCETLDAAGLTGYRIGLGDASLFPRLLDRVGASDQARPRILHELVTRDFVGLEREAGADVARVAQLRGGPEVLDQVAEAQQLRAVFERLDPANADRVIFDLGLTHTLGYYTGEVFEVYDAGLGAPLGGGGRYDDLIARFGRDLPACGWALNLERVHLARVGEGR
jgi:ATP phosphoribosyltransferase regulatory subunit HisZ